MTDVTREIISDLWPLYVSGDVSPATRTLVEEFLAADPEFARRLRAPLGDPLAEIAPPSLPPDHELKTLQRVKRRLWGYPMLLQLAMVFSALAFGRIISDTSWDVSPRNFIVTSVIAAAFWIAFAVTMYRGRKSFLIKFRS
jgi:anti-sigma factor RsiW